MTVPPPLPPPPAEPPPPRDWPTPPKRPGKLVGALVGLAVFVVCLLTLGMGGGEVFGVALLAALASIVAATIALVSESVRPYAIGYLIFWGVTLVVLGGLCAVLIAAYSGRF